MVELMVNNMSAEQTLLLIFSLRFLIDEQFFCFQTKQNKKSSAFSRNIIIYFKDGQD
jgi:hypothetical protein